MGWLGGYQMAFDTSKSQLTKNNFAIGYSAKDFTLHTNVNDGQVFGGSVHQKVNNSSQVGLGYQQKLREGVTLCLSTLIDGKNFQQGGHRIGMSLELEA